MTIVYEKKQHVAWIYLNRPEQMNAISKSLLRALAEVLQQAQNDEEVHVVVLSGKGQAFCAGADLKELLQDLKQTHTSEANLLDEAGRVFTLLEKFEKPMIAAVNGMALAGGLELVMTADIVVAAKNAKFGDAHANFGVLPGAGGAVKLPRKIGLNRAKYLLFTGDFISAEQMKAYGLVQEIVEQELLEMTVQQIAERIAEKSPLVLQKMKELVADGLNQPLDIALKQELLALKEHTHSYDFHEGLSAFQEKRKPVFKGY